MDALNSLAAPDATWWMSGLEERIPLAGTQPYEARPRQLQGMLIEAKSVHICVKSITAEGDCAVLEMVPRAEPREEGGKVYENEVLMKFEFGQDGKITAIKEYVDSFFTIFKYLGVAA